MVPGYTDDEASLTKLHEFIATLDNVKRVEVLPYHSFGAFKWEEMKIPYQLKDTPSPSEESIAQAKTILGVESFAEYEAHLKNGK